MKRKNAPASSPQLVGRSEELTGLEACVRAGRSVLLEGPVGVGKTKLAVEATARLGRKVFRVDGDSRYTEQKLTGWFDPPAVLKKGYVKDSFIAGPLVEAMQSGGVLFINELNRLPEGVQNVLLPAIDEKTVSIPRLGTIRAKPGFVVIATQNPKEFVATSHLSEAILDRFELITVDYQSEAEEVAIVGEDEIGRSAVKLARLTRGHPRIRRGASIRAAQAVADLTRTLSESPGVSIREAFLRAAVLALPTRIEIEREAGSERSAQEETKALVAELSEAALGDASLEKKN